MFGEIQVGIEVIMNSTSQPSKWWQIYEMWRHKCHYLQCTSPLYSLLHVWTFLL